MCVYIMCVCMYECAIYVLLFFLAYQLPSVQITMVLQSKDNGTSFDFTSLFIVCCRVVRRESTLASRAEREREAKNTSATFFSLRTRSR